MVVCTSTIHAGKPCAKEHYIDSLFLCFYICTHLVYNAYQAHVGLYECILALRVERFALGSDTVPSILRTAYEVSAWSEGVFCKLLESCFADTAGGSDEDCDELWWKSGRDAKVR